MAEMITTAPNCIRKTIEREVMGDNVNRINSCTRFDNDKGGVKWTVKKINRKGQIDLKKHVGWTSK